MIRRLPYQMVDFGLIHCAIFLRRIDWSQAVL
jgi:hypothetical protein